MKTSLIKNSEELKQSIVSLEKDLLASAVAYAQKIFANLLEQIDLLILQHRPADLTVAHKRDTWYRTGLGTIRITRRQYKSSDGKYHYLLDELMGMDKYHHTTLTVKEIACRLAGEMPFRKSAEVISDITPIDISFQTIHRLVQTSLANSQDRADQAIAWFEETGELQCSEDKEINRLMIEADGVMLSLQRESSRKIEVKLGIAYEGWQKVGKERYGTTNKTIYADIVSANRFWSAMTMKLHQIYDLSQTQYVIGGDGAPWIREGAAYFGGQYQLCRYHLNRALCHALGHDSETLRSVQYHCNRGDIGSALKQLKKAAAGAQVDKAKEIRRMIKYISSNASGLKDYREEIDQTDNTSRRTGAIEGNIDKLIVRRMKNQGMSWSIQGIRRMLWLRIKIREGTLNNCLHLHIQKKTPHVPIPKKQINRVIDRTIKYDYHNYFNAGLPALSGPHASHYWVELLKNLTTIAI